MSEVCLTFQHMSLASLLNLKWTVGEGRKVLHSAGSTLIL